MLVLLPSGELREYPRPATAVRVLEDACGDGDGVGGWFLCEVDQMGFEGPVAAVAASKALFAWQIYSVLLGGARCRGLGHEEVVALAIRASIALSIATAATARSGAVGNPGGGGAARHAVGGEGAGAAGG